MRTNGFLIVALGWFGCAGDATEEQQVAGRAAPLVATPEPTITPETPAGYEMLGRAVAVSSDGSRAILGGAGAARVFVDDGASWSQEAILPAPGTVGFEPIGGFVALSADGSRALVGAPYEDTSVGRNAGAARVFLRTGTTWTEEANLPSPDAEIDDRFGSAVALSPDASRAAVARPGPGTVGVYLRTGTSWAEETTLGVAYADALSFSADAFRLVVGSPALGQARVYVRAGTSWSLEATLPDPEWTSSDPTYHGGSVAIAGDGSRAMVGAVHPGVAPVVPGKVRAYVRSGSSWTEEAVLSVAWEGTRASEGEFGRSLALSTDGSRALIGMPGDSWPVGSLYMTRAGSARVFERVSTGWSMASILVASDGQRYDRLGNAVALTPDGSRAFVGMHLDEVGTLYNVGTARVWTLLNIAATGNGTPCTHGGECPSSFCVDGVCCETACGGGVTDDCQTCSVLGGGTSDGSCTALSAAAAPSVVCRPGSPCDLEEVCLPTSTECPEDSFEPSTTLCRESTGACDPAEHCSGSSPACPADDVAPFGTSCADADRCNGDEVCRGDGTCVAGSPPDCDDGNACTADACDPSGGCTHTAVDGCCPESCDDGDPCTEDACSTDGSCNHSPVAGCDADAGPMGEGADAGPGDDAGAVSDAGDMAGPAADEGTGGCSCRVARGRSRAPWTWLAEALVLLVLVRRRRRERVHRVRR